MVSPFSMNLGGEDRIVALKDECFESVEIGKYSSWHCLGRGVASILAVLTIVVRPYQTC